MGPPWTAGVQELWGTLATCTPLRPRKDSCERNGFQVGVEVGRVPGPLEVEEGEGLLSASISTAALGSCPFTFPNKGPEKSGEPACFINRFLTDFSRFHASRLGRCQMAGL